MTGFFELFFTNLVKSFQDWLAWFVWWTVGAVFEWCASFFFDDVEMEDITAYFDDVKSYVDQAWLAVEPWNQAFPVVEMFNISMASIMVILGIKVAKLMLSLTPFGG